MNKSTGKFFILGTQRSGTTLLRLILNSHSKIAIPKESVFLCPLLKKKYLNFFFTKNFLKSFGEYNSAISVFKSLYDGYYRDYFSQPFKYEKVTLRDLIDDIFTSFSIKEGKSIWGNKTTSFFSKIDLLHNLFPEAKFIHIVRDGRDVFDSRRRFDSKLTNVAVCAIDWKYKLNCIEKSFKKISSKNKIVIRYEDLLDNPEKTLKSICSLLEIDYETSMLNFNITSQRYAATNHSKLISKPLDKNNKYKWKNNLNNQEIKIFNLLAKNKIIKYNYELKNDAPNIVDIIVILKSLFVNMTLRFIQISRTKQIMERGLRDI